ncbi:MAG TPA: PspC domain-containing protein [Solirubrobacteraceae bacterium]|nr:PspC domain-containing protein [Solirubrobacteraceae bacterium]
MTDTQPTMPQPEQPPRRLTRSTTDRMIGGVAGGLGRHLNIDPLAIRITFVILTFAGGLGLIAYLLCVLFVPVDDPSAPPLKWGLARTVGAGLLVVAALAILIPDWFWGPLVPLLVVAGAVVYLLVRMLREDGGTHAGHVAARIAIGIVLVALAVGGFVAAAAGTALGGGIVVAGLVIACGVGLVGGAFRGGARWLIVPAVVLALPLAAVAATDLDVRGTWGDRTFRPATVAELAGGYEMGVGSLKVDMRDVQLPAGRTDLPLEIGMGEIQVLVQDDVCVTTDADVGVGAVNTGEGDQGGIDVDVSDDRDIAPGVRHLHVIADVGIGHVMIGDRFFDWDGPGRWRDDRFDALEAGTSRAACQGAA